MRLICRPHVKQRHPNCLAPSFARSRASRCFLLHSFTTILQKATIYTNILHTSLLQGRPPRLQGGGRPQPGPHEPGQRQEVRDGNRQALWPSQHPRQQRGVSDHVLRMCTQTCECVKRVKQCQGICHGRRHLKPPGKKERGIAACEAVADARSLLPPPPAWATPRRASPSRVLAC